MTASGLDYLIGGFVSAGHVREASEQIAQRRGLPGDERCGGSAFALKRLFSQLGDTLPARGDFLHRFKCFLNLLNC